MAVKGSVGAEGRNHSGGREPSLLQKLRWGWGERWPISSYPHSVPDSGFLRKNSLFSFSIQDPKRGTCAGGGREEQRGKGGSRFLFLSSLGSHWPQISAGSWLWSLRSLPGQEEGEGQCVPSFALMGEQGGSRGKEGTTWSCLAQPQSTYQHARARIFFSRSICLFV